MGERLLCKQEVDGSIPFTSTTAARCAASSRAAAAVAELPRERRGAEKGAARASCGRGSGEDKVCRRAEARAALIFDRVKRE